MVSLLYNTVYLSLVYLICGVSQITSSLSTFLNIQEVILLYTSTGTNSPLVSIPREILYEEVYIEVN